MTPLWKGPRVDGITASLLSNYIVCKERFRLLVVEGLEEEDEFDYTIEYGNIWHLLKECHRAGLDWKEPVTALKHNLLGRYPANGEVIEQWFYLCVGQFLVWKNLAPPPQRVKPVQLITEDSFRIPYTLPSGRELILRGKYDSISLRGNALYIEDDKSKGKIDEAGTSATLFGNLQMGLYHTAARQCLSKGADGLYRINGLDKRGSVSLPRTPRTPYFAGTKYHIVRRPLSEHFPMKKRAKETPRQFWDRIIQDIANRPDYYFITIPAEISTTQVKKFQKTILDPWLENLLTWWDHVYDAAINDNPPFDDNPGIHMQTPWGVYNSLFGGFRGDYFEYLAKGSDRALVRKKTLFPELEEEINASIPTPKASNHPRPRPKTKS